MRRNIIIILFLTSCLLFAERTVSLEEAVELAMKNNDEIIAAKYERKSTSWEKYSALSSFLPTATFSNSLLQMNPAPTFSDNIGIHDLDNEQKTNTFQVVQPLL